MLIKTKDLKVEKWVSYQEAMDLDYPVTIGGLGGFFNGGHIHDDMPDYKDMRWLDYLKHLPEQYRPYAEVLRKDILDKGIRKGGDWHQNSGDGVPIFNDKTMGLFSYRSWGDLLAAIYSEKEDINYTYMSFYMMR